MLEKFNKIYQEMQHKYKHGDYIYVQFGSPDDIRRLIFKLDKFIPYTLYLDDTIDDTTPSCQIIYGINAFNDIRINCSFGFINHFVRLATEEEKKYLLRKYKEYKLRNEHKGT